MFHFITDYNMDDLPFEVYLTKGQSGLGMSLTGGDNGGILSLTCCKVEFRRKFLKSLNRCDIVVDTIGLVFRQQATINGSANQMKIEDT